MGQCSPPQVLLPILRAYKFFRGFNSCRCRLPNKISPQQKFLFLQGMTNALTQGRIQNRESGAHPPPPPPHPLPEY